jgi:hypothetical protein
MLDKSINVVSSEVSIFKYGDVNYNQKGESELNVSERYDEI